MLIFSNLNPFPSTSPSNEKFPKVSSSNKFPKSNLSNNTSPLYTALSKLSKLFNSKSATTLPISELISKVASIELGVIFVNPDNENSPNFINSVGRVFPNRFGNTSFNLK